MLAAGQSRARSLGMVERRSAASAGAKGRQERVEEALDLLSGCRGAVAGREVGRRSRRLVRFRTVRGSSCSRAGRRHHDNYQDCNKG